MKFRFRFKKRSSNLVTLLAGAAFIWLATARLGLPKEKVLYWLLILVILLLILIATAAIAGLVLRRIMGQNNK